jgi:23S rRNA (cytidine1920-2'-O)/16S rRNA (cytidine1409-2'-O)-methyltransferase
MTQDNPPKKSRGLRIRVDQWVCELGFAETRTKAQALIMAGEVLYRRNDRSSSDWMKVEKAGQQFYTGEVELKLAGPLQRDVGRGTLKLRGALDSWPEVNVQGAFALDLGSSTGGFTQVLLERGAKRVVAMDVGTHQLHERLREDPRVIVMEQTHVLKVDDDFWKKRELEPTFDVIVTDVSFISLTKIVSHVEPWLRPGGHWILLVKPQFEVGPRKAPGGIVKNPLYHQEAIDLVRSVVQDNGQLQWKSEMPSPIKGGDGNVEFLVWLRKKK